MKDLYIVGAGGFGREVAWLAERMNAIQKTWNIIGFIDDNQALHGTTEGGYPILGGCDYFSDREEEAWVVCAVGAAKVRKMVIDKLMKYPHVRFASLIDPSVLLSDRVEIREGTIVCAGTILTVDITIGKHVIINLDCTVGHDAQISDYVTVYPSANISGNVTVGECVELGTGAQIIQGKSIADGAIVGAGAVVVKDIAKEGTYIGVPAHIVGER